MAESGKADDLKKKFAEALGNKKDNDNEPATGASKGPEHAHGVHGMVDNKRMFRRKSG